MIKQLEAAILRHAGGYEKFRVDIPRLHRRAIDEVIDSARSNRFVLLEIEKTEETYIGTKIEILLRNHLGMVKGHVLDLAIDGIEVDIKNTIAANWTIPAEAVGHPCILLQAQETTSRCSFGLLVVRESVLNEGRIATANGPSRKSGSPRSTSSPIPIPLTPSVAHERLARVGPKSGPPCFLLPQTKVGALSGAPPVQASTPFHPFATISERSDSPTVGAF